MTRTATIMALLPLLLLLVAMPLSSLAYFTNSTVVKVYDNVLPEGTRKALYTACEAWGKQEVVFRFPLESPNGNSHLEQVMNDILWKLYPEATPNMFYVEYWKRQTWNHILAHADMDEGLREEQEEKGIDEPFAHPKIGHVLYLQLGSKVKGPTCVWANTTFGGTLLEDAPSTDMYIVPAVESRLLCFQGDLLHAVPRPADLWLHPTHENEQGPDYERMVLLFNIWPTTHLLRGHTVREFDPVYAAAAADMGEKGAEERSCHAFDEWKPALVQDRIALYGDNAMAPIQFPIMGDERRRGTSALSAMMETNSLQAHAAFDELSQPTRIVVQPRRKKKKSSWLSYMGIEL